MIKAILLISGNGSRFGSRIPKQFLNLSGKKIYRHALETFLAFKEFKTIILVCHKEYIEQVREEIGEPRVQIIEGGATRQESSYRGLLACGPETSHVMIHDGARPFVSQKMIQDSLNALHSHAAVNTCIPSTDTIVHADTFLAVTSIPDRSKYLRGQTPQSFSYPLILEAHEKAKDRNVSDDCRLVLELNHPIHIIYGSENNIKITTELDLFLAEQLVHRQNKPVCTEKLSLKGKRFVITGGTGGIGSALNALLKEEGAFPFILSRSSSTYPIDLTDYAATSSLFKTIGPIDGLINCIGSLSLKPFHALECEEIDATVRTNLHAFLYSCHAAQIKPGGHLINVSSSSFSRGRKLYTLYSSAKAAIINFTQGLAEERLDLHINAVIPQRTATAMRKRNFPNEDPNTLLNPLEVAQEILWLLKQKGTTSLLLEVRKK